MVFCRFPIIGEATAFETDVNRGDTTLPFFHFLLKINFAWLGSTLGVPFPFTYFSNENKQNESPKNQLYN